MIDFDAQVNMPCMLAFGVPVTLRLRGRPPVSALPDGSPLLGVYNKAQKDVREENGVIVDTARPRLGLSLVMLRAAGVSPDEIDDEDTVIEVGGECWGVMDMMPPDSQGDVQVILKGGR